MSYSLIAAVWEVALSKPEQIVLQALAWFAKDDGSSCFPSVDLVAYRTGYKPRQVIEIMRKLRRRNVIVRVAEARQHRPAEYEIHLENAPQKIPFEDWRAEHGRSARRAPATAPLERGPEEEPGVQSRGSGVQSRGSGVQSRGPRDAAATAPEPVDPSNDPSDDPPVGGPGPPAAEDLVALFYDSLEEARTKRGTPKTERRAIPTSGANCRGAFAHDVKRELDGGRDPGLLERAVRRRAIRWDDFALDLPRALNDALDGKPFTVDGERESRRRPRARSDFRRSDALVAIPGGRDADERRYAAEGYR